MTSHEATLQSFMSAFNGFAGYSPESIENLRFSTDATVALRILNQFRLTLETSIRDFTFRRNDHDWVSLNHLCHKLAGSSELVGFFGLGRDCRTVMQNLETANPSTSLEVLDQILKNCQEMLRLINDHCPELKSYP